MSAPPLCLSRKPSVAARAVHGKRLGHSLGSEVQSACPVGVAGELSAVKGTGYGIREVQTSLTRLLDFYMRHRHELYQLKDSCGNLWHRQVQSWRYRLDTCTLYIRLLTSSSIVVSSHHRHLPRLKTVPTSYARRAQTMTTASTGGSIALERAMTANARWDPATPLLLPILTSCASTATRSASSPSTSRTSPVPILATGRGHQTAGSNSAMYAASGALSCWTCRAYGRATSVHLGRAEARSSVFCAARGMHPFISSSTRRAIRWRIRSLRLARMAPLIPRARALCCTIRSPEDYRSIASVLSSDSIPNLHSLSVEFNCGTMDHDSRTDIVLARDAQVTDVRMSNVIIRLPEHGRLTSLDISLTWAKPERLFRCDDVLDILSHNPSLKAVSLAHALRKGDPTSRSTPIVMPVLSRIKIVQTDSACLPFDLLRHLRAPQAERLHVSEYVTKTNAVNISDAMACTLATCIESPLLASERLLCSLAVHHGRRLITDVSLQRESDGMSTSTDRAGHDAIRFVLFPEYGHRRSYANAMDRMSAALQPLRESGVASRVVELDCFPGKRVARSEPAQFWRTTLSAFPYVSALRVQTEAGDELVDLFDTLSEHEDGEGVLPRLERLVMKPGPMPGRVVWFPGFERMLRERVGMGSPIREIRIDTSVAC
ncbi:unnamed protein product [Peniophora sp. CBMAI 1063]|nr:unnamed protein product [Peniophora sp. CBMAI 1063]